MAKNILSRMDEIIEDMMGDWKGLFLSNEFSQYLKRYASVLVSGIFESLRVEGVKITKGVEENILKGMDVQVIFDPNDEVDTACTVMTDKKFIIMINGAGELVRKVESVREKFEVVMGLLVHEINHRIFTDFPTAVSADNALRNRGQFFPLPPKNINTQEGMMFRARLAREPEYRGLFADVLGYLRNATEDGYIEAENRLHYPGEPSYYIDCVNEVMRDSSESITDIYNESKEIDTVSVILNQWLQYAKFSMFKAGELGTEILDPIAEQILFDGTETIDEVLTERDPRLRMQFCSELLVKLCPLIDEALEKREEKKEKDPQNSGDPGDQGTGSEEAIKELREQLNKEMQSAVGNQNGKQHENCTSQSIANPNLPGNSKMDLDALKNQPQAPIGPGGSEVSGTHEEKPSERSLESILNDLASKQAKREMEKERTQELQDEAQKLVGDQSVKVFRAADVDKERKPVYDELYNRVRAISQRLVRLTRRRFKEEEEDASVSRLMSGNRLDLKHYVRDPLRGFERRVTNDLRVNLEVFVLIDESGSMSGEGEAAAMQTAILLEDFCRQIPIPLTVYGYTTGQTECDLYSFVEPVKIDNNDKYRLTGISAYSGTPTVEAMTFAIGRLHKSDPKVNKLLFVITDGYAGDDDWEGTKTRKLIQSASKDLIQVIGCGIGSAAEVIGNAFGEENFISISTEDLGQMPERLLQIVQRGLFATRR